MSSQLTRSSSTAEGMHNVLCQFISFNWCTTVQKILFEKAYKRWMTSKIAQCDRNCLCSIGHTSLPVNARQYVICILHSFGNVTIYYGILPHLQCAWVPVTLRSPSVSTRRTYKPCALSDSCKLGMLNEVWKFDYKFEVIFTEIEIRNSCET